MIAVTMGDGNGVGPEIILNAFRKGDLTGDFLVVGDWSVMKRCNEQLKYGVKLNRLASTADFEPGLLNVLDTAHLTEDDIQPGVLSAKVAAASREYIVRATQLCLDGLCDAMCTLPVNKEAIRLTDGRFTGHTELIAEICGQKDYTMMLASDKLIVTHVSTHCSLQEAINRCTRENVLKIIRLTDKALARMKPNPRIAVAGLNPHAGENGAFGRQDIDEIAPAVIQAHAEGINATGPDPAETVFMKAVPGHFDAVVCMYHDQGHVPMKLLDFHGGVNVTLGLKVIRTSVDHGTAFDIAWKGIAEASSFVQAYNMALKMTAQRGQSH